MAFANLVAFFIILTTAVTLHAPGKTDIQTSADAAEALRPIAGDLAFALFSLGIIGTGLLAVPVLAGSAAYAVCESRGWTIGLSTSRARRSGSNGDRPCHPRGRRGGLFAGRPHTGPVLERCPQWRDLGAADGRDDDRGLPQGLDGPVRRLTSAARTGKVRHRLHGGRGDHDVHPKLGLRSWSRLDAFPREATAACQPREGTLQDPAPSGTIWKPSHLRD